MWHSGALPTSLTVQETLDCFLSKQFLEAYHTRCGHSRLEIGPTERSEGASQWKRVTRFAVSMTDNGAPSLLRSLLGALDVSVEQTTVIETLEGGTRLLVRASSVIPSGPASRLASAATWDLRHGEMRLQTEVKFGASGFAQRLVASSVEQSASGKARESMELWWQMAQQQAAQGRLLSPISGSQGVQRALSFEEDEEEEEEEEEEDDDGAVFEDACSILESPSLQGRSGLAALLAREAGGLNAAVEGLRERRERLELRAAEQRPDNPLLRLLRWANRAHAAAAVAPPARVSSAWLGAAGAAGALSKAMARTRRNVWMAVAAPWLLFAVTWLALGVRQRGRRR